MQTNIKSESRLIVMWQPKAWYDSTTCNKWVAQYALKEMAKAELEVGQRHLILCDNLASQTKKSNPTLAKLLDQHCGADVFNLLAGAALALSLQDITV